MTILRAILGWIARHALVFALIVAALVAHQWLSASYTSTTDLRARLEASRAALVLYERQAGSAIASTDDALARGQSAGLQALDARILAARTARGEAERIAGRGDLAAIATADARALAGTRLARLRVALLTREIASLEALRDTLDARRPGESLQAAAARQVAVVRASARAVRAAGNRLAELERQNPVRRAFTRQERDGLRARIAAAQAEANRADRNLRALVAAERRLREARAAAGESAAAIRAGLLAESRRLERDLAGSVPEKLGGWAARVDLAGKARAAALILLGIILMPFAIRTLFYYVLAPFAERRRAIRLGDAGQPAVTVAAATATSIGIRPAPGEELLVRQGFLQSSARGGAKATQWLLDWRHPISSIAAGLTFLTRISAHESALTTVSAVDDAFAEVAMIDLPEGAACVLQPRALVGVVQPAGRPLRITGKWRLTTLAAWLTLQLRFLVFHGPARLIVKGGRGVRVEAAEKGRVFGQDQLVGFSTDLAYSVTRTETFAPYLFGRESLLKDQVAEGGGVLIVEEAPSAGRKRGVRQGLEGLMDAGLKVFGI